MSQLSEEATSVLAEMNAPVGSPYCLIARGMGGNAIKAATEFLLPEVLEPPAGDGHPWPQSYQLMSDARWEERQQLRHAFLALAQELSGYGVASRPDANIPEPPSKPVQANCNDGTAGRLVARLDYFKRSGKWYSNGSLEVPASAYLQDIWQMVRELRDAGNLPDLVAGAGREFNILVNVPGHRHEHPHMIMA